MYLDVGKSHEVLGDVNNELVHESRSNVKTIHSVVQVVPKTITINIYTCIREYVCLVKIN